MTQNRHEMDIEGNSEEKIEEIEKRLTNFFQNNENKIQDLWHNRFIDDFYKFVINKRDNFNWHRLGKFLEFSAKIYGIRVDELLKTATTSSNTLKVTKKPGVELNKDPGAPKAVVRRKNRNNIVSNPEILNRPIEMIQSFSSPRFRTVTGNPRSEDMLTNVLTSNQSSLRFPHSTEKFWDPNPRTFDETEQQNVTVNNVVDVESCVVRESLLDVYQISDEPLENNFSFVSIDLTVEDDFERLRKNRMSQDSGYQTQWTKSMSQIGDVTDMDSFETSQEDIFDTKVNAHSTQNDFSMQSAGMDVEESSAAIEEVNFSQMAMDDENPQNSSEIGQQEENSSNGDFLQMPDNSQVHEYSYRPEETTVNYWAGPSYWKFIKRRVDTPTPKPKAQKFCKELTVEDVVRFDGNLEGRTVAREGVKYRKQTLPVFYDIPLNYFDYHLHAPDKIEEHEEENFNNFEDPQQYVETNISDHEEAENSPDNFELDMTPLLSHSIQPLLISRRYENKNVNMEAIKEMSQKILEAERSLSGNNGMKFSEMASKCSKMMENESTSTALIFSAILHKANEGKIEIVSEFNKIDDFLVRLK